MGWLILTPLILKYCFMTILSEYKHESPKSDLTGMAQVLPQGIFQEDEYSHSFNDDEA